MISEKYAPQHLSVGTILGSIESGDIAIPEIQRPFVWKKKQVRDLLDSLYKGYPTGYLTIWINPNVKLKDGSISTGKKIIIDGQQRVTALMTAIAGNTVVNEKYGKERIKIAFNPFEALSEDKDAEIFAVQNQSHLKWKKWIPDVAEIFKNNFSEFSFIKKYCEDNPEMDPENLDRVLANLRSIINRPLGVIELSKNLDIDIVTDIFIRINSKGTPLSQGDFVMSKMAADESFGGNMLRKAIDYFAHLCVEPNFYNHILKNDSEFAESEYMPKLKWLKDKKETVYVPGCIDILRVAFMHMYPRVELADLVKLLSGRDFKTKEFKVEIIEETYHNLKEGVLNVINQNNFNQFVLAIKSAGFVSGKLINSQVPLNFAYVLYLRLTLSKEVSVSEVKRIVQKWYVLSVLTERYSGSAEQSLYHDILHINENGVVATLERIEADALSDNFWNNKVVQNLSNFTTNNPTYLVYLAAQVYRKDISLLSNNILVRDLIEKAGDAHHIFPKEYLMSKGFDKNLYNQNANYAHLDTQVNKSIGKKGPNVYFAEALHQCETKEITCGSITDLDALKENLEVNCIPFDICNWDYKDYETFLSERRIRMAGKIKEYYCSL